MHREANTQPLSMIAVRNWNFRESNWQMLFDQVRYKSPLMNKRDVLKISAMQIVSPASAT